MISSVSWDAPISMTTLKCFDLSESFVSFTKLIISKASEKLSVVNLTKDLELEYAFLWFFSLQLEIHRCLLSRKVKVDMRQHNYYY